MAKRLINMLIISAVGVWMLTGCNNADNAKSTATPENAQGKTQPAANSPDSVTTNAPMVINWSRIDSGERRLTKLTIHIPLPSIVKMSATMPITLKSIMPPPSTI